MINSAIGRLAGWWRSWNVAVCVAALMLAGGTAGAATGQRPDLTITALTNPPTVADPGDVFRVDVVLKNIGQDLAQASVTRFRLSVDGVITHTDLLVGQSNLAPLAAGVTVQDSVLLTVPANIAAGDYFLGACADDDNTVVEINESNNCYVAAQSMHVPKGIVISAGDCFAAPGGTAKCNVTLSLLSGVQIATLQFGIAVESPPVGGGPPLTSAITFNQVDPLPDLEVTAPEVSPGVILTGWVTPIVPPLSGTQVLGVVSVPVPSNAQPGQTYHLRIFNPSATSDGKNDMPIAPYLDGTLTVSDTPFLICDIVPAVRPTPTPGATPPPTAIEDPYHAGAFGDGKIEHVDVVALFKDSLALGCLPALIGSRPTTQRRRMCRRRAAEMGRS